MVQKQKVYSSNLNFGTLKFPAIKNGSASFPRPVHSIIFLFVMKRAKTDGKEIDGFKKSRVPFPLLLQVILQEDNIQLIELFKLHVIGKKCSCSDLESSG